MTAKIRDVQQEVRGVIGRVDELLVGDDGEELVNSLGKIDSKLEEIRNILVEVWKYSSKTPCTFWACEGPENIQDMVTCNVCKANASLLKIISNT